LRQNRAPCRISERAKDRAKMIGRHRITPPG
jgi:hypothetical protein